MPRMRRIVDEEELALKRSARRLRAELGINPAGVEVILRMRRQMIVLQGQMAQLEAELDRRARRRTARLEAWRAVEVEAWWEEL